MRGYLYIIQIREFIRANEPVYKIGRAKDIIKRTKGYPKGSELLYCVKTDNYILKEKIAINLFKTKFTQKREFGTEYFEGNLTEIIKLMTHVSSRVIKDDISATETSEEIAVSETSKEVIALETSEEIAVSETSEEIAVSETREEIAVSETSKEVIALETSEEIAIPESTTKKKKPTVNNECDFKFECSRCGKKFPARSTILRHLNAKRVCPPKKKDINLESLKAELVEVTVKQFVCKCGKSYGHSFSFWRHKQTCPEHTSKEVIALKNEIRELKNKLKR